MRHYGLRAIDSDRREGPARRSREAGWARVGQMGRVAVVAALVAGLGACTWTRGVLDPSNVNYRSAKTGPGLDVPPDLIGPKGDDRYVIPEAGTGKTYSDYSRDRRDRAGQAAQATAAAEADSASAGNTKTVLPAVEGARMARDGQIRWLVIDQAPEKVWPQVVAFWQAEGIALRDESPSQGTMDTEWVTRTEHPERRGLRGLFSRAIGSTYTTSMKDAYRTRVEPAPGGGTEIYVSQRALEEVVNSPAQDSTIWQPGPNRPELEVEMLRRMMLRIGHVTPAESRAAVAAISGSGPANAGAAGGAAAGGAAAVGGGAAAGGAAADASATASAATADAAASSPASPAGSPSAERSPVASRPERAVVFPEQGELNGLKVHEGFERAWREVGLAIDRVGFTVEDRDRSKGTYFVRYVDLDRRDPRQGALSRLFSGERKDLSGQRYQIRVAGDGSSASRVEIRNDNGITPATDADVRVANRIVALLHERMR